MDQTKEQWLEMIAIPAPEGYLGRIVQYKGATHQWVAQWKPKGADVAWWTANNINSALPPLVILKKAADDIAYDIDRSRNTPVFTNEYGS